MYIIINRTSKTKWTYEENFPDVDDLLNRGFDIIIISLYSNTIKVPYKSNDVDNDTLQPLWDWKDYSLFMDIIAPEALVSE